MSFRRGRTSQSNFVEELESSHSKAKRYVAEAEKRRSDQGGGSLSVMRSVFGGMALCSGSRKDSTPPIKKPDRCTRSPNLSARSFRDPSRRGVGSLSGRSAALGSTGGPARCDKCDSTQHVTRECPWYKKNRESHPDATRRKPLTMGSSGGNVVLRSARVVRMPGDGSCLFHSLSYGIGARNARKLREEIADFVSRNPTLAIAETPLSDWVKWDSGCSVRTYARRMARSGWGGGIEIAAFSRLYRCDVHVYEKQRGRSGFKRISCFDFPGGGSSKVVHILYCGGVHYNSLTNVRR